MMDFANVCMNYRYTIILFYVDEKNNINKQLPLFPQSNINCIIAQIYLIHLKIYLCNEFKIKNALQIPLLQAKRSVTWGGDY